MLGNAHIKILILVSIFAVAVGYAIFKGKSEPEPLGQLVPVVTNPSNIPTAKAPKLVPLDGAAPSGSENAIRKEALTEVEGAEEGLPDEPTPEQKTFERAAGVFENEPVDPEWAPQYQDDLMTMFTEAEALSQVSVNSIECRTSMCRVLVFTPSMVEANQLNSVFYATVGKYRGGMFKSNNVTGLNNFVNGVTALYIAKPGRELSLF